MNPLQKTLDELLVEHRDKPSPTLRLDVPLQRLLDREVCEQLSKTLKDIGGEWEVMKATEGLSTSLPKHPGLYMFVWRPMFRFLVHGRPNSVSYVLYVGQAGADPSRSTIQERYKAYAKYLAGSPQKLWEKQVSIPTRPSLLEKYLMLEPLEFWYLIVSDTRELKDAEDRLIMLFNPPLNGVGKPKMRLKEPGPAFPRRSA